MPGYAETWQRVRAVLQQRWRWLYLACTVAVCVVFQAMSQEAFRMTTPTDAMWCMGLFVVFYIASLSFIVSFDLIKHA
jgi:hypothetical protein